MTFNCLTFSKLIVYNKTFGSSFPDKYMKLFDFGNPEDIVTREIINIRAMTGEDDDPDEALCVVVDFEDDECFAFLYHLINDLSKLNCLPSDCYQKGQTILVTMD